MKATLGWAGRVEGLPEGYALGDTLFGNVIVSPADEMGSWTAGDFSQRELQMSEPKPAHDLTVEEWREYDFGGRVYRIEAPRLLVVGSTTHRVVDSHGVTHCLPAPGYHCCVLRWKGRTEPVSF